MTPLRQAWFGIRIPYSLEPRELSVALYYRQHKKNGELGGLQKSRIYRSEIALYRDPADREILSMLFVGSPGGEPGLSEAFVHPVIQSDFFEKLARTGRGFILDPSSIEQHPAPLLPDPGNPWRFELALVPEEKGYKLEGFLTRKPQAPAEIHSETHSKTPAGSGPNTLPALTRDALEKRPLSDVLAIFRSGCVIFREQIGRLESGVHYGWMLDLRRRGLKTVIPFEQAKDFAREMAKDPHCPVVDWPAELEWKRISGTPAPVVTVSNLTKDLYSANFVRLGLEYRYGVQKIGATATQTLIPDLESHTLIERDFGREREALARFETLGLEFSPLRQGDHAPYRIIPSLLPDTVRTILSWGWPVEAEGKKVQPLQKIEITTESGIDWFELKGRTLLEEGNSIVLPALLAAIRNHGGMIALGDGAIGMVPEEWLSKFASFAALGTETEEGFRFTKNQGLLVSLWLLREETTPAFQGLLELKKSLGRLTELKPLDPPDRFHGTLRPYQKEGIGWLKVLEDTGMGGILADDMGLGKTVQLLAHLAAAARAQPAEHSPRPSLILLPKSLLHNWADEAARFTPDLRVLLHHGTSRSKSLAEFSDYDLILMTYATARIDFDRLREVPFRYLIADEAQAIKNPASQVSRVSKLLQARHRIALTGTPIENSIEDLLSIMDFANPGLLGRWKNGRNSGEMKGLAKAISPFILRRTKQQVLSDLPPKTELTLPCELSPKEKKNYAALRDHYRMSLKNEISSRGMARSKLKVLEALLRLRQAACHPGLIDQKMRSADSTKIDLLVEQLRLIGAEGHKALVFSQFTSFLDLVKSRLEREGITYEYLDGQTSDRSGRVKRFQEDPDTGVFLISLKAGGTGLNLTAADYVFLLDPWWNPAVESQAIDRAHRIGQKNKVMAYRLIAKDTIEEKIVQLQKQKRELADAIVNADHAALLRSLTPKDLDELLS